jgi:serine/threonine-protein kinase
MNGGHDPLEGKTKAQSPQALLPRNPAPSSPSQPRVSERKPTVAEGLDRSTVPRMRAYHAYAIAASLFALAVSFFLEGDAFARHLLQAGMAWLCLVNVATVWFARSGRAWDSRIMTVRWVVGGAGLLPLLYYFGPFSALTLVFPLALMFIAMGRDPRTGNFVLAFALGGHLLVAAPILLGWTTDVGLVRAPSMERGQLAIMEAMVLGLMLCGHALGRWARHTSEAARAELADARRIIGDQKQVIVEVQDRVDQVNRVKTGRWTGQTVGRWQLGSVLGRGAMGEVYEAHDAKGQAAAVKVLTATAEESPSLVERFNRELQIAAHLDSPHIVRVLDVSTASAVVPYLAMERLRGVELAARLRNEIRMPLNDVVGMLGQVARGLEVAHNAGVVHRDLKPHNLFLHDSTCWKILDFGVAKVFGIEGTLTRNAMIGTPQYMAPEQASGEPVTHLSDIYALGAIAYRCLTGRVPHGANDFTALLYQVVHGAPVRPRALADVSPQIEDVLAVAMAKDPRRRFTSASEFVDQLVGAAAGRSSKREPPTDAWA